MLHDCVILISSLVESLVDTSFQALEKPSSEPAAATKDIPKTAEEDDEEDFQDETTAGIEGEPSPSPSPSEPLDHEEEEEEEGKGGVVYNSGSGGDGVTCPQRSLDFWAFFGGFFMGLGIAVIAQSFVTFWKVKKKTYNTPYQFDSFVNQ